MKKTTIVFLIYCLLPFSSFSFSEIATFQDGTEKQDSLVSLDAGKVVLKNGGEGKREEIGMYMATSDCPMLSRFFPLARFHLPFASIQETG